MQRKYQECGFGEIRKNPYPDAALLEPAGPHSYSPRYSNERSVILLIPLALFDLLSSRSILAQGAPNVER
jgi:hypothetical protein